MNDTIAAIATPPGEGGVGIVRISGPGALKIAEKCFRGRCPVSQFESHRLYSGVFVDAAGLGTSEQDNGWREGPPSGTVCEGRSQPGGCPKRQDPLSCGWMRSPSIQRPLDHVLMVYMKAPHSYTGEDVVEVHAHGGRVLLERILEVILSEGATRLARPGEFTERAFLNGKIDLVQAEAIADLIGASSELGLELASSALEGRPSAEVRKVRDELIGMRSEIEGAIDFPEEVSEIPNDQIAERCRLIMEKTGRWLDGFEEGRFRREGIRVVIAGRPNVGKSSLLNALLGEDRVIVHEEAGTTRDVVEETIHYKGLLVRLSDTAGLRECGDGWKDVVEAEGIRRSWGQIERADLILFVIDGSMPPADEDLRLLGQISARPHLVVANKCDLRAATAQFAGDGWREGFPSETVCEGRSQLGGDPKRQDPSPVSARTGEGIDALKERIFELALPHGRQTSELFLANARHKHCLEKALEALSEVERGARENLGPELVAADLLVATNHLGEITGEITHKEILDGIFSRFCVGK